MRAVSTTLPEPVPLLSVPGAAAFHKRRPKSLHKVSKAALRVKQTLIIFDVPSAAVQSSVPRGACAIFVSMSKCPTCGNVYPDPFRFCPVDGAELDRKGVLGGAERTFEEPSFPGGMQIPIRTLMLGFGILLMVGLLGFAALFFYQYLKPKYGGLVLKTTPPGAMIFVDGKQRGVSPITIGNLRSGGHQVRAVKEGYKELLQQVGILPYTTENQHWTLEPLVPQLSNEQLAEVEAWRKKLDSAQKENILLPLSLARKKPDPGWFDQVIDTVDLRPRLSHKPSELSGGQQQRVACARALVSKPDIVFADEPTGNLDSTSAAQVLDFLRHSVDDLGQTIVMVSHDPVAASYCDRVIFLADGRVVDELAKPSREEILAHMADLQARAMGLAPIGEGA